MRKNFFLFLTFLLLLAACSPPESAATPTLKPALTFTATRAPTQTTTPTITPSPTIIKIPTVDYNSTPTPSGYTFSSPTPFPWISTSTPLPTSTPSTAGEGFEWVRLSEYRLYWGSCRSNYVTVTAMVTYPEDVYSMTLFVRFRRATAQIFTPWSRGLGMEPTGAEGVWSQKLYGSSIENHILWRRGWVWYQIVAVGVNNLEVGRTHIFADMLKLEPCMCLTPPCAPGD